MREKGTVDIKGDGKSLHLEFEREKVIIVFETEVK